MKMKMNQIVFSISIAAIFINSVVSGDSVIDCIRDIEAERFQAAEKKLEILSKNATTVAEIIHKVYRNKVKNIRLLNDFGKSLTSIPLTLLVYLSLADDLDNISVDPVSEITELISLIKSVQSEIIDQQFATDDLSKAGLAVSKKLRAVVKTISEDELEEAMHDGSFSSSADVATITAALYNVDANLFYDVISDVCSRAYSCIDKSRLFGYINGYDNISPTVDGLVGIFYAMRKAGDLDSDKMVELAFDIKAMVQQSNYDNIEREVRNRLQYIEGLMPKSLASIAFYEKVCIKNRMFNEYLFASTYTLDGDRRRVFTWQPGTTVSQGNWKIERSSNGAVTIKNVNHNEYLFSSNFIHDGVLTWIPGTNVIQDKWRIISSHHGIVKIVNIHNRGRTLRASDGTHAEDRRNVEATEMTDSDWNPHAAWEIEKCMW